MSEWKPRVKSGLSWASLDLTAEEGFLLSRIDGATSVTGLCHLTGLSTSQVQAALQKFVAQGAIDAPSTPTAPMHATPRPSTAGAPPSRRTVPTVVDEQPALFTADESAEGDVDEAMRAALADMSVDDMPAVPGDDTDEGSAILDAGALDDDRADEARTAAHASDDGGGDPGDVGSAARDDDAPDDDAPDDDAPDEDLVVEEGNSRKLYETTLHALPQEEREKLARTSSGPTLLALCFDPVPQVIAGVFQNPDVGFPHARLVARHHRTPQGIDAVFQRAEFVRDGQVQRYLMANPMLQDGHIKKLTAGKRIAAVYQWALSRDLPEKNRAKLRNVLRSKWATAEGEERANLVFSTEGRVLAMLTGLPFDSQAAAVLCGRSYNSVILIQNLARFAATPPVVLQHMLKQALVKRQPHLRTLIAQHPNCPSDVKRKLRDG